MRDLRALAVLAICIGACTSTTPPARTTPQPTPAAASNPAGSQRGLATWYGESQMTASGEVFDKHKLTAAHRTLPLGSIVRVTNAHNGKSVVVRINDRGPYSNKRIIDLSEAAARVLDMIEAGVVPVTLEVIK